MRELFGDVETFPVFNGTGGNVTALGTVLRPFEAVICPQTAHINVDECGAPERFSGCKLVDLPTPDGKLTPELVAAPSSASATSTTCRRAWCRSPSRPSWAPSTRATETVALAAVAHEHGLLLHVDGARLTNAAVSLGTGLREITTDCGVDVLSFGGTKNGLLGAEAVVFFTPGLADGYPFVRKQGMQLASKMRFVSAQLLRLLRDDLWRETAGHANGMAGRLADGLRAIPGVRIAYPVEANAVFPALPGSHRSPARAVPLLRLGRVGGRRALHVLVADDARRGRRSHRRGARGACGRLVGRPLSARRAAGASLTWRALRSLAPRPDRCRRRRWCASAPVRLATDVGWGDRQTGHTGAPLIASPSCTANSASHSEHR